MRNFKEFWKNKKVLITGHTGFKGSWLTLYLLNLGAKVTGLALNPNENQPLFNQLDLERKIHHNIVDINNLELVKEIVNDSKPDFIFHLAAQPLVRESYINPLNTWKTNVFGSLNLLESIKDFSHMCSIVIVTTDKVYKNINWHYGYRENDPLGGYDPYSSSKAALEIAVSSWRDSFCGTKSYQNPNLFIATCRAGNVIGGGDWGEDRIIPDIIRNLQENKVIKIRNKFAIRPWQHVLEPISGYVQLAKKIYETSDTKSKLNLCGAFNFGPNLDSNRKVSELVNEVIKYWKGTWIDTSNDDDFHEAKILKLNIDKSYELLNWKPKWEFGEVIYRTIMWYKNQHQKLSSPIDLCLNDIKDFQSDF